MGFLIVYYIALSMVFSSGFEPIAMLAGLLLIVGLVLSR